MICPICKTDNGENPKNCSNCGWEFVYFLTEPSEIEIENHKLKVELAKLKYEQQQTPPPQKKDDIWIDRLIEWVDENNISQNKFPRDRKKITNLTELDLHWWNSLTEIPAEIGNLTNLTYLCLNNNPNLKLTQQQKEWIKSLRDKNCVIVMDNENS